MLLCHLFFLKKFNQRISLIQMLVLKILGSEVRFYDALKDFLNCSSVLKLKNSFKVAELRNLPRLLLVTVPKQNITK